MSLGIDLGAIVLTFSVLKRYIKTVARFFRNEVRNGSTLRVLQKRLIELQVVAGDISKQ